MALQDITEKILEDAKKQADEERKRGEVAAQDIQKDAEVKKQQLQKQFEEKIELASDNQQRAIEASYRQKAKRERESTKHQLLDQVFDEALQKLHSLDDQGYEKVLAQHLKAIQENTKTWDIIVPASREKITQETVRKMNFSLGSVEMSASFQGGCVLRSGQYEYDLSFENLLRMKRPEIEMSVASILFKDE